MSKSIRIIYAGTPDFAVAPLESLIAEGYDVVAVYTQPDRPAGRGREPRPSPVKQKALEHDIPVFQPESLKPEVDQNVLSELKPDLMVVTAYGLLLPQAVLGIPRLGCINIHASLLPRWRGAAPIQRAILAGDKKTGISIMQMDEGLDTGNVLAVGEYEMAADETGASLHDQLMLLGAKTLMLALPAIVEQASNQVKQDEADACYASKLTKAEAKINWLLPGEEIGRAIRAYNSWPVAYCFYEKNNKPSILRLWRAEIIKKDTDAVALLPGKVIAESAAGIDVMTVDGVLRITQLQAEGKRMMSAADFLNANSLLGQTLS